MANPFEDENGNYYALINEEGQYSLWPTFGRMDCSSRIGQPGHLLEVHKTALD
jgi:MbtH protein